LPKQADRILAVSEAEAANFRARGFEDVHILGHAIPVRPTPAVHRGRSGLLFVGGLTDDETPNTDSVVWFIRNVLPILKEKSSTIGNLKIVGRLGAPALEPLVQNEDCDFLGRQDNLESHYDAARIFIAPTRFAAGIPLKVIEAAAHGLPIVGTSLIVEQLGWEAGKKILAGDTPEEVAASVIRLDGDPDLWNRVRNNALERISKDWSHELFDSVLETALPADRRRSACDRKPLESAFPTG